MHFSLLVTLLSAFLVSAKSEPEVIRVQHRIVHPSLATPPWSTLGTVPRPPSISPHGSPSVLIPSDALLDDIAQFSRLAIQGAMYQVALERPGITDGVWPTSIVKACYLPGSTSAHLTIHFSPSGLPFAIDHFLSPVPHDGSCPPLDSKPYPVHNTTVTLMSPRQPPRPDLRTPPPLTPEGEPIAPAPEKSFLQKYWVYMIVILGVLLISGPVEESASNGGGQGGR